MGWATEEFSEVQLGDKRLDTRLIKLFDTLSEAPESPINQACEDWSETKAAYRFFQNDNVDVDKIMAAHRAKTAKRIEGKRIVLSIQDTSFAVYTKHPKTQGLGVVSLNHGKNKEKIYSHGLAMHTCLALSDQGDPLGLLSQNIAARELRPENQRPRKGGKRINNLPVEEKESYRWIEALEATASIDTDALVVTICDRECDFYDFFKSANDKGAAVVVRASQNRTVNKTSRYAEKEVEKLREFIERQPLSGTYQVEVSALEKTKHCKGRTARTADIEVRFAKYVLNPPRNHPEHKTGRLSDIDMYAVYAREKDPPEGEDALDWMLLCNLPVESFKEACERVRWYSLRWRIEMYFKVLKSGFRVESCRLATADRLTRYLTVMSIIAWRLFSITLIARTEPDRPCTDLLSHMEWTVLYRKAHANKTPPKQPPKMRDVVISIAKLGGYLARKSDGPPGTLAMWRGWKRLADLVDGWRLAANADTCG